ncbi:bifunctional glycosyltransferase family 2/GtrA family protein [Cellulosimicrobium sp. 72-3]|uniref:bifunctional glycosyltransferase family 2/GtrA family protein n=1 Tax=Cellulosimicrobium sp. 72-3 TaxID=2731680 RepID=UPI00148E9E39|nr:bifunctional glycosyltransferase family 2/GtrA family protein [Cellulosimicrobium sp. 72-3]
MTAATTREQPADPATSVARTAVVVPAYQPDARLVALVDALRAAVPGSPVVVVDDGSDRRCGGVLRTVRALGAVVLTVPVNRGKGHALRTGIRWVRDRLPGHGVVCADADGQHTVVDVLRVAARSQAEPEAVVLGARRFAGDVPVRSRVGNAATRWAFAATTGTRVRDTQTGLRAYGPGLLDDLLAVRGDRYEYELRALLEATRAGRRIVEVDVATVYLDDNASSHFRPVADSLRVWAPLLRFAASSLGSAAVDVVALLALHALTGSLLAAVVGARLLSAGVNFAVNRRLVFPGGRDLPLRVAAARYVALAVVLLAASYGLLALLTGIGLPLLAAKVGTDAVLVATSYEVQRRVVFAPLSADRRAARRGRARDRAPSSAGRPT